MADRRHVLGLRAESAAARWLEQRGWIVLVRRHRTPAGELDLVCRDPSGALVGVEVKLRSSNRAGQPSEALDGRRIGRLRRALATYAAADGSWTELRIDLVTFSRDPGGWRLRLHRGVDGW